MPDSTGAVSIDGVTKLYGTATAVDNLTLDVRASEFLSLLGPSGCGKTTTLRMIAGFEYPDAGDIRISGRSVLALPPHRREVNTVFQAYALFPHLTVAENVAYGLQQRKVPKAEQRERVSEALDMVQLRSFADRKPSSRVVSSSASPCLAPSSTVRACFCSTSRSPPSTASSARRCSSS